MNNIKNSIKFIEKTKQWISFYNRIKIKKEIEEWIVEKINEDILLNFSSPNLYIWNECILVAESSRIKLYSI